jgi:hypothetical protein
MLLLVWQIKQQTKKAMHYFTTIGGLVVVTHATSKLTNLIHLARESFWED